MSTTRSESTLTRPVVHFFSDAVAARAAINELIEKGFDREEIGIAGPDASKETIVGLQSYASEGMVTGVTAGAGAGVLYGIAILSGIIPVVGPILAGGTLSLLLTTSAIGATAAGTVGALIGMGLSKSEAGQAQTHLHEGRIMVSVRAHGRETEAHQILSGHGSMPDPFPE